MSAQAFTRMSPERDLPASLAFCEALASQDSGVTHYVPASSCFASFSDAGLGQNHRDIQFRRARSRIAFHADDGCQRVPDAQKSRAIVVGAFAANADSLRFVGGGGHLTVVIQFWIAANVDDFTSAALVGAYFGGPMAAQVGCAVGSAIGNQRDPLVIRP